MRLTRVTATASSLLLLLAAHASAQPAPGPPPPGPPRAALARLYQGRRAEEQSDRLSRKIKLGRNGRVSITNVAGDITVTAGSGDEMAIEAVKHGDRGTLDRVSVVIDDRPGRVDVRTEYDRVFSRNNNVSVDYTVTVPGDVALDVYSVSGQIKVDGVKGSMRIGSVSGDITSTNTPMVEYVRTVSGKVELSGVVNGGSLSLSSVSGSIGVSGVRTRSLDLNTVSGDIHLRDAAVERLTSRSVSGGFEYSGALARSGSYEVNSHAGDIRFTLADSTGFELNASSFSGSIRSDYAGTTSVDRRRRGPRNEAVHSTVGDGSARLELRSFSGNIVISKR
jgi:DUF4097 and DUF4098 domain-containing protein YvlB